MKKIFTTLQKYLFEKEYLFYLILIIGIILKLFSIDLYGIHGIIIALILISLGLFALVIGGNNLLSGGSSIAKFYKIPPIVIGLTIISFGTSAPEFVVNVLSALKGESELLIANIIGSNISNILLILGISSIIITLLVANNTIKKEIPISLISAILILILANDTIFGFDNNMLSRFDGIVLLIGFAGFLVYIYQLSKNGNIEGLELIKELPIKKSVSNILIGIFGLYIGGELVVNNAIIIAESLNVSKILIGATIVAIGTSLPELTASILAALKKQADIAIGNVVGSNIFNILWIGGASILISPVKYDTKLNFDISTLIIITIILFLITIKYKNINKYHGIGFLVIYGLYIGFVIYRG